MTDAIETLGLVLLVVVALVVIKFADEDRELIYAGILFVTALVLIGVKVLI
jgi:hypothetical protein